MTLYKYIILVVILLSDITTYAQTTGTKNTTATFNVAGVCEQCKARIEDAAIGKGVLSAEWDLGTKEIKVVYDSLKTSLEKIQKRIVAAGHDLQTAHAPDNVYNKLPACCHYRESEAMVHDSKIETASKVQLKEFSVTSKQTSTYISALNTVRTETITSKELLKAACCNLSESFDTNPSVDVSYNDAVTGSKQIQLLGLSGNYTQLTVENLPGPRGIATPLGLNSIAGPWIESIQLVKGMGSVANGYESIAGQINVELKKPENSEQMLANVYVNDFGKTDLNLNLSKKINGKWSTGLLIHDDFLTNKQLDNNKDGFRDLPTGNLFSIINRWKYDNGKGFLAQFGIKTLKDDRTGGQTAYNPSSDKYTTKYYGIGINTQRYEAFGKVGYIFPAQKYKSIGLQLSAISHKQDSYFGLTTYNATQRNIYGNLIYQSIVNNTMHTFRTGISFLYDKYDEQFNAAFYKRNELVPGAFFEYTYMPSEKLSVVAGIRADHNNLFGVFITPRLNVRYEPVKGTNIRLAAGRGQRTANIFAENASVFVSARSVEMLSTEKGKAYGFNPEVAWNKGISVDQHFNLFRRDASASIDFYRNDFTDQVVVDLEDPRTVKFYNSKDKSYANSLQVGLKLEPLDKFNVSLAYRYFDVKTTYDGKLLQRPLISKQRAFANFDYAFSGWKFDYTFNYNGSKRLPSTAANPETDRRNAYSPAYILMNAQVTKAIGKKRPMDFYIGVENIGNYIQQDAIIAANDPFGRYFDASLVWAPITGRMLYAGWRLKIK
ncbi:cation transporter [Chitinophaga pinensis]|uniref:TonB-dependent receptor n=1 Tax=Chitinophaga pinensis (strain ATCC 43595 / DSM 2588 / LMG 13176 / NBRC 15968 / NCIMB 11800 / UQM 2034) TaxID=485918 RepID=A0A979GV07_CHIPD|nr:cation transporter [Chitinophaga pinensis]ACU63108.1 TonB-dependent receptor [Chitinophaga pinensis DSM 2588]